MPEPISDDELIGYVANEVRRAESDVGTVANDRAEALRRFKGEPYGDEEDGRSKAVARDTLETIMYIQPQLVEIFMSEEESIAFAPVSEEDVPQARQETQYIRHVFWKDNPGFLNMLEIIQDALLQKTGCIKARWEDSVKALGEEIAENLTEQQLMNVLAHEDVEPIEITVNEDGTQNVRYMLVKRKGRECIETFPPEDLIVSEDVRSIDMNEVRFCAQRSRIRRSDLVEMGFDQEQVYRLGADRDARRFDEQSYERYSETEEDPIRSHQFREESTRELEVFECYFLIDQDGDGISERHKVFYCEGELLRQPPEEDAQPEEFIDAITGESSMQVPEGPIVNDIVSQVPIYVICPYILSHKLYGMSVHDMVRDIERIRTALWRGQLDNLYRTNNPEGIIWEDQVESDDWLVSKVGMAKRAKRNPAEVYQPLVVPFVAEKAFLMHEHLDHAKRRRTGAGDGVAGLDDKSLADVNTGVAHMAKAVEQQMIRMIARTFAETGLSWLFLGIHKDLQEHQRQPRTVRITGDWVEVDPTSWIDREAVDIEVGLGSALKEVQVAAMRGVMEDQQLLLEKGFDGILVAPQNLYAARKRMLGALGIKNITDYYVDPQSPQGQQAATQKAEAAQAAQQAQQEQLMTVTATEMQRTAMQESTKAGETARKAQADADLDFRERAKLELEYQQNIPGGLSPEQAERGGNGNA